MQPQPQIAQFSTYLIDLDGVIYRGETLVPGARDFIDWLNINAKKYFFLTNNSFASEVQVLEKLTRLGITSTPSHVLGAAQAAVKYIAHHNPDANVYIIGEQPLAEIVRANHLKIATLDDTKIDTVLVGLDRKFDYIKLTRAILAIRAGAAFIAINRDPLLPVAGGLIAGTGTLVAAIEAGSEVAPIVIGKPKPTMLQEAMRLIDSQPEETIMIGDNLNIDIVAGQAAGTHTLFVLSGKDTRQDLEKSTIAPDFVYEDLAAVMKAIKEIS